MAMIKYLEMFFEEKKLPHQLWELTDPSGAWNLIGSEVVLESIGKASVEEQNEIADVIRKIDFENGDVNHFLKHLAQALVDLRVVRTLGR